MAFDTNTQSAVTVILIILYLVLILGVLLYIQNKVSLKSKRCEGLKDKIYPNLETNITDLPDTNSAPLRDYYIKTAYNCCAVGMYKNSYVGLCALNASLGQGFRCLDFEIYSIDKVPVVAVSSLPDFNIKESYNSIPLSQVLAHIQENAFSATACPNPSDPLFLNLRIKTKHREIYDKIAAAISTHLEPLTLGKISPKYSYGNSGSKDGVQHNLFGPSDGIHDTNGISFKDAKGRVIIMVEKSSAGLLEESQLYEYTNVVGGGSFLSIYRYSHGIKYTHDYESLIESNKHAPSIVLPDLSASDANYNFYLPKLYGCTFIAMAVQDFDENLEAYDTFFSEDGHAFVLKPENLRFKQDVLEGKPALSSSQAPHLITARHTAGGSINIFPATDSPPSSPSSKS